MECSLPGSSVHGVSQARILERVAIFFSRGSSWPRDWIHVSCTAGRFFPTEPPGKPHVYVRLGFFIWLRRVLVAAHRVFDLRDQAQASSWALCADVTVPVSPSSDRWQSVGHAAFQGGSPTPWPPEPGCRPHRPPPWLTTYSRPPRGCPEAQLTCVSSGPWGLLVCSLLFWSLLFICFWYKGDTLFLKAFWRTGVNSSNVWSQ